jgi:hypothetical protein
MMLTVLGWRAGFVDIKTNQVSSTMECFDGWQQKYKDML